MIHFEDRVMESCQQCCIYGASCKILLAKYNMFIHVHAVNRLIIAEAVCSSNLNPQECYLKFARIYKRAKS